MSNYPSGYNEPEDLDHYLERIEANNEELRTANEALAARVEQMREALHKLACLGNGDCYGNSVGNSVAQGALAHDDTATSILAERDARTLRMAAEIAETPVSGEQDDITMQAKDRIAKTLRAKADELAKAGATEKQS